jgi:hypothetical protein
MGAWCLTLFLPWTLDALMRDPDLESLKRSIDLAEYARSLGYEDRPRDSVPAILVLEHPGSGDRVAVASLQSGGIYARIPDYVPRAESESEDLARRRLRDCITRSGDTGSVVEFVCTEERRAGRPEPDLEAVRQRLALWELSHERTRSDGVPSPPMRDFPSPAQVQERIEKWHEAQRVLDRKLAHLADRPPASVSGQERGGPNHPHKSELAQRRYDWSPPVVVTQPTTPIVDRVLGGRRGRDEDRGR